MGRMRLQRITGHLRAQNWTAVTIDLVIVVVGVYLGLQVSNWNDARNQRAREVATLGELSAALSADAAAIEDALPHVRRIAASAEALLAHMRVGKPYEPMLNQHFGIIYGFHPLEFNRAGYESLKSQGLDLVSDNELRSDIVRVYERTYARLEESRDAERRIIIDLLEPYFLKHFEDMRFNQSATPLDYDALLDDPQFLNLIDYRLQVTRQNQIPTYERAVKEIRQLVEDLRSLTTAATGAPAAAGLSG